MYSLKVKNKEIKYKLINKNCVFNIITINYNVENVIKFVKSIIISSLGKAILLKRRIFNNRIYESHKCLIMIILNKRSDMKISSFCKHTIHASRSLCIVAQ